LQNLGPVESSGDVTRVAFTHVSSPGPYNPPEQRKTHAGSRPPLLSLGKTSFTGSISDNHNGAATLATRGNEASINFYRYDRGQQVLDQLKQKQRRCIDSKSADKKESHGQFERDGKADNIYIERASCRKVRGRPFS